VESTELALPSGSVGTPVLLAVGGFVLVIGIEWVSKRLEHRDTGDEVDELHV
jgi:hypothetical protein